MGRRSIVYRLSCRYLLGMEFVIGAIVTVFLVVWGAMSWWSTPGRSRKEEDDDK